MATLSLPAEEIDALRLRHYNATVDSIRYAHDDLMVMRVRPDGGAPQYKGGQYTVLGLGYWEQRAEGCKAEEIRPGQQRKVAKRAYSISSPILDDRGNLLDKDQSDFLEFYIVLVRDTPGPAPVLTPRLFCMKEGDRIFVGPKVTGHYTLAPVETGQNVVLLATGTGEAPHNAMILELLGAGHSGAIASAVCVRYWNDLAYHTAHNELMRRYPNYVYFPLTTREPVNLDEKHPEYKGKQYIQNMIESGALEQRMGFSLDPAAAHVFLCGNPAMIGIPEKDEHGERVYPEPLGAIELLERRGFIVDESGEVGNIHFEKYW